MARVVKKSPVPLYGAAAVWAVWALCLPMYRLVHFILAAAVSVCVRMLLKKICRDRVFDVPDPEPEAPQKPAAAGSPEIDALLAERDRALSEMRRLNDSIEDEKISGQIDHLEEMTTKIIAHVAENPKKLPQIRRFLNYYLPTTLKLLNAYDRMDSVGVSGTNIDGAMGKIDAMMDTVVQAFDKQMDALFADEALDVSTDIAVMEQLLAREGIGGIQMKTEL